MTAFRKDCLSARLTPFQYTSAKGREIVHKGKGMVIVYFIPLAPGSCYIGQMASSVNIQVMERKRNLNNEMQNSEVATHVAACAQCPLVWDETVVL